jgi:NADH-quinone oxidoreductase subunit A
MTTLAVIIFMALAAGSAIAIVAVSRVLGGKPLTAAKDVPYECGMPPAENPGTLFSVRFYKVALLFVVFDIEIVFITILLAAFFFAWWKGDLRWE